MFDKGQRHKYCFKSMQNALGMQIFTQTGRMMSKVITKHICTKIAFIINFMASCRPLNF